MFVVSRAWIPEKDCSPMLRMIGVPFYPGPAYATKVSQPATAFGGIRLLKLIFGVRLIL